MATTDIGQNRRRWSFSPPHLREAARGEPIDERAGKLRPFSFFFVLEVDEHLVPGASLSSDGVRPFVEIGRCVAFVAQPEVAVAGGRPERRRLVAEIRDTER